MGFYDEYFSYDGDDANAYKEKFVSDSLENGLIYKFVSLTDNNALNQVKINCLINDTVWASFYKYFDDQTELKMQVNYYKVARKTGRSLQSVKMLTDLMRELYDIVCFTNRVDDYMWKYYSNEGRGICLCFRVNDFDKFFPIEYIDKKKFDLTQSVINSINNNDKGSPINSRVSKEAALYPLVLKDMNYINESEIRVFESPFDDGDGIFGGFVRQNVKDEFGYKGQELTYRSIGLSLESVIIGRDIDKKYKDIVTEVMKEKAVKLY